MTRVKLLENNLRGKVRFEAEIQDVKLSFESVACDWIDPNVRRVEFEGHGKTIISTIHLDAVLSKANGREIATRANENVLNHLSFRYSSSIKNSRIVDEEFSASAPKTASTAAIATPDTMECVMEALPVQVTHGPRSEEVMTLLQQAGTNADGFRLKDFRYALQATDPVLRFMLLYRILLEVCDRDDKQQKADDFIRKHEKDVPRTPRPGKPQVMETVYTRLRNELAHNRKGKEADLRKTRAEMHDRVGRLRYLVQQAIEGQRQGGLPPAPA